MIGAIIQARMGSSRLPGKVLKEIGNKTLLEFQIDRIQQVSSLQKIIVATSTKKADDPIEKYCFTNNILCFRGSENDVLSRYFECASFYNLTTIIRLTADCPFTDPRIIDKVVNLFFEQGVDYCSNTVPPDTSHWPDGSDVEVFSFQALERAHKESIKADDREHVTFYFWQEQSHRFKTAQLLNNNNDWSKYRFTVDYPEDLKVVNMLSNEIKSRNVFGHIEEIINILKDRPDIKKLNEQYYFGLGWKQ